MAFFLKRPDKKSGDGLALTEWNDLCNAVAGYSGLKLAIDASDKVGIGTDTPNEGSKLTVQGNVTVGAGDKTSNLLVNGSVGIGGNAVPLAPLSISAAAGKDSNPDGSMHITNGCILFGGSNNGREVNSAQISAGKHVADSLNIVGMTSGTDFNTRKVEIWAEGGLKVNGSVSASKFIGDGSQLTNLSVGLNGVNLATAGGNVGIGTLTPSHKIHVVAAGGAVGLLESSINNAFLRVSTSEGFDKRIEFCNRPGGRAAIWVSSQVDALNILANGNVGIGTESPNDKLDVKGTLRLSNSDNACKMYLAAIEIPVPGVAKPLTRKGLVFEIDKSFQGGNSTAKIMWDGDNNWDSLSDERLKTKIEKEENILDRLMRLDVKNYNWMTDPDRERKMIGFVAQEVKPLFPALVGEIIDEETKEHTMTLKYASFGVLAAGAIKELKLQYDKRITELEKEIALLKDNLNDRELFTA